MEKAAKRPVTIKTSLKLENLSWRQSIRWPLLIAISGNVLLTLLLIGWGITVFISSTEQESWQVRQAENAREASALIQNFVKSKQDALTLISMGTAGSGDEESEALSSFLAYDSSWLEIVRLNKRAEPLFGATTDRRMLQNMFTSRQAQWFSQAQQGRAYLGNVHVSPDDAPYMILSVPSADGGVVAGRLRMDVLWDVVSAIHFGESGLAYIINQQDGRVIAFPEHDIVLSNQYINNSPIFESIQEEPNRDEWNGAFQNFQGMQVQTHAMRVPQTNWIVVTEVKWSEVTQTRELALQITAGGLLLLWIMITYTSSAFLKYLVLQPIEHLRVGADRIGHGDLQHRIPGNREDELGRVTEQFNQMASELEERENMLVRARDKALVDSQFKSDLLAKVSHDLRTPLGVILGFAEMLRDEIFGPVSDKQRQPLNEIMNSTSILSGMVSDLLDAARLDAHTLRLRIDKFAPEMLLRQVRGQMSLLVERKGLQLTTELDPQLPATLEGDANRINQILANLVGNAVKFTQSGSVYVCAYLYNTENWAIAVRDTGPGIAPEALEYIFEPFRQVNDPATRDKGGIGLGLSIVQQLVQLMGGEIRVESKVGAGSNFIVILPLTMRALAEK